MFFSFHSKADFISGKSRHYQQHHNSKQMSFFLLDEHICLTNRGQCEDTQGAWLVEDYKPKSGKKPKTWRPRGKV